MTIFGGRQYMENTYFCILQIVIILHCELFQSIRHALTVEYVIFCPYLNLVDVPQYWTFRWVPS